MTVDVSSMVGRLEVRWLLSYVSFKASDELDDLGLRRPGRWVKQPRCTGRGALQAVMGNFSW